MQLRQLTLTNFRNFAQLDLDFEQGPTLFVGANAQGKTSLLEAVYYLSGAQSPHASSDRQLIQFTQLEQAHPFARLLAKIERGDRLHTIEIRIQLAENDDSRVQKQVLVNGISRRISQLAEAFNTVLFLPQDLGIVEGSPGGRRRFLDRLIGQADSEYADQLARYNRALSQRNALLKHLAAGRVKDESQLEVWEQKMAESGAGLITARGLALHELQALAQPIHDSLSRGNERLLLAYEPAFHPVLGSGHDAPGGTDALDFTAVSSAEVVEGLLTHWGAQRAKDRARRHTGSGPHRDDVRFAVDDVDLRSYGSRGQNRTAILSAKMAEVNWLQARIGDWPVLLLDEVLAELDAARRHDLLDHVAAVHQSLITAADGEMFTDAFRRRATMWRVSSGSVQPFED